MIFRREREREREPGPLARVVFTKMRSDTNIVIKSATNYTTTSELVASQGRIGMNIASIAGNGKTF